MMAPIPRPNISMTATVLQHRPKRYDEQGKITLIARADGWCMVRRPREHPFVVSQWDWDGMSREPPSRQTAEEVIE
jgi:hypothetical protein